MKKPPIVLSRLNAMDQKSFTEEIGFVFELSPWIAEQSWAARPFATIEDLHAAMREVVEQASAEQRLTLLRMHPDLAGRAAIAGDLTDESKREQSLAGLSQLTSGEYDAFIARNDAYKTRFGIPFIICAREHNKASILASFDRRLLNEFTDEVATAIGEVNKISRLRLEDAVTD